jgi:virulence-associated protein VagC
MADGMLLIIGHLGEGASVTIIGDEDTVITEPAAAPSLLADVSLHRTLSNDFSTIRPQHHHD